jgi:predicted nucleic acid-binding Zn ribbon protein
MPLYDYQCASCEHRMEAIAEDQRRAADRLPGLPGAGIEEAAVGAGFRLSGNGWYETDFKTGAKKNLAGGDKAD